MFERFTERAREAVVLAQNEAERFNHNYVGTEHLLLGLRRQEEGVASQVLRTLGVDLDDARERIEAIVGPGEGPSTGQAPFTPRSKRVLQAALREAHRLGHNHIGTEHLLLGLTDEPEGVAARVLVEMGADLEAVRSEVFRALGVEPIAPPPERPVEGPGRERPFYRSRRDRQVAGVYGGIAEYFGWDPKLVRLAVAGLIVATGGAGLAAYLLFWIFVPLRPE